MQVIQQVEELKTLSPKQKFYILTARDGCCSYWYVGENPVSPDTVIAIRGHSVIDPVCLGQSHFHHAVVLTGPYDSAFVGNKLIELMQGKIKHVESVYLK